jgi:hypothetical protein
MHIDNLLLFVCAVSVWGGGSLKTVRGKTIHILYLVLFLIITYTDMSNMPCLNFIYVIDIDGVCTLNFDSMGLRWANYKKDFKIY